ncbi:unnamed protein product [Ixodes pacificus]
MSSQPPKYQCIVLGLQKQFTSKDTAFVAATSLVLCTESSFLKCSLDSAKPAAQIELSSTYLSSRASHCCLFVALSALMFSQHLFRLVCSEIMSSEILLRTSFSSSRAFSMQSSSGVLEPSPTLRRCAG